MMEGPWAPWASLAVLIKGGSRKQKGLLGPPLSCQSPFILSPNPEVQPDSGEGIQQIFWPWSLLLTWDRME